MAVFLWVLSLCLIALSTAENKGALTSLQQQAQALADPVVGMIESAADAIPAFISAAKALNAASDHLDELLNIREEIGAIKESAKSVPDTNEKERRPTLDRIQELYSAVQQTRNKIKIIQHRTRGQVLQLVEDAVGVLEQQAEIIPASSGTNTQQAVPEYYVEPTLMSLTEAQENCDSKNMVLVSITTETEAQALYQLLDGVFDSHYWTGAFLLDGGYYWAHLENMPAVSDGYTHWGAGYEPATVYPGYQQSILASPEPSELWQEYSFEQQPDLNLPSVCQTHPDVAS